MNKRRQDWSICVPGSWPGGLLIAKFTKLQIHNAGGVCACLWGIISDYSHTNNDTIKTLWLRGGFPNASWVELTDLPLIKLQLKCSDFWTMGAFMRRRLESSTPWTPCGWGERPKTHYFFANHQRRHLHAYWRLLGTQTHTHKKSNPIWYIILGTCSGDDECKALVGVLNTYLASMWPTQLAFLLLINPFNPQQSSACKEKTLFIQTNHEPPFPSIVFEMLCASEFTVR